MDHRFRERGDTLVEVLMAVVILSVVIVGAITLMARGLSAAQTAVEHTQVRMGISGQTEMLRFLRDAYIQDSDGVDGLSWVSLFNGSPVYADNNPSSFGGDCEVTSGKSGFYLEQTADRVTVVQFDPLVKPTTAAMPGEGLWVEATRSPNGVSPAYVDFQLRACWEGIGSAADQQIITGVRLYDPAH